jgi:hypothetical protein
MPELRIGGELIGDGWTSYCTGLLNDDTMEGVVFTGMRKRYWSLRIDGVEDQEAELRTNLDAIVIMDKWTPEKAA